MISLNELSLREKIGQLFMFGFHGVAPSKEITQMIEEYQIGGVIYFSRNTQDVKQIFELSNKLQEIAQKSSKIPLFISIDQEGGMVARIVDGITLSPGNMAIGATRSEEASYELAKIVGEDLKALGINMNFAPCIDINNNPKNPVIGVRSYGEDPELVSNLGRAEIKGYQEVNVSAVVKHFPGHGDTEVDSHLDLPAIPYSLERLHEVELVPFKEAIRQEVDAVMVSHVSFPKIEKENRPATLSFSIITELLRENLSYKGIIMTDCMEMKAIVDRYGMEEAAVLAVEAGIDLVLISHDHSRQKAAIDAVIHAVETGRISERKIDESVQRLLNVKYKRNVASYEKQWSKATEIIGTPKKLSYASEISEKSITVVKNEVNAIPLSDKKTIIFFPEETVTTGADENSRTSSLAYYLSAYIKDLNEVVISKATENMNDEEWVKASADADQIIVCTYNRSNVHLANKLIDKYDDKVIVVALRNPYDLNSVERVRTYLTTYESRPLALNSLAKILTGKALATGKLPVSINENYSYGWSGK